MEKTIKAIGKSFENKDGKAVIYDSDGRIIAEFRGEIQEECHYLFLIRDGRLYDIVEDENGTLSERPYRGYSLVEEHY